MKYFNQTKSEHEWVARLCQSVPTRVENVACSNGLTEMLHICSIYVFIYCINGNPWRVCACERISCKT